MPSPSSGVNQQKKIPNPQESTRSHPQEDNPLGDLFLFSWIFINCPIFHCRLQFRRGMRPQTRLGECYCQFMYVYVYIARKKAIYNLMKKVFLYKSFGRPCWLAPSIHWWAHSMPFSPWSSTKSRFNLSKIPSNIGFHLENIQNSAVHQYHLVGGFNPSEQY